MMAECADMTRGTDDVWDLLELGSIRVAGLPIIIGTLERGILAPILLHSLAMDTHAIIRHSCGIFLDGFASIPTGILFLEWDTILGSHTLTHVYFWIELKCSFVFEQIPFCRVLASDKRQWAHRGCPNVHSESDIDL